MEVTVLFLLFTSQFFTQYIKSDYEMTVVYKMDQNDKILNVQLFP